MEESDEIIIERTKKQEYLREEILEKGFDSNIFQEFLEKHKKNGEKQLNYK